MDATQQYKIIEESKDLNIGSRSTLLIINNYKNAIDLRMPRNFSINSCLHFVVNTNENPVNFFDTDHSHYELSEGMNSFILTKEYGWIPVVYTTKPVYHKSPVENDSDNNITDNEESLTKTTKPMLEDDVETLEEDLEALEKDLEGLDEEEL